MSDWRNAAKCLGADPDIFFPPSKGQAEQAKRFCHNCEVAQECFTEAIQNNERGVWGGVYLGADTAKEMKTSAMAAR